MTETQATSSSSGVLEPLPADVACSDGPLLDLPAALIIKIASSAGPVALLHLRASCRQLRSLCTPLVDTLRLDGDPCARLRARRHFLKAFPAVRRLQFSELPGQCALALLDLVRRSFPQVKSVELSEEAAACGGGWTTAAQLAAQRAGVEILNGAVQLEPAAVQEINAAAAGCAETAARQWSYLWVLVER